MLQHGWCWMVFRAFKVDGGIDVEILECAAGETGFRHFEKSEYERNPMRRSIDEWYYESWQMSDYKNEIALDIAKEFPIVDDHYFEYVGEYEIIASRGYYGEYDEEERISDDSWQEISKKEYEAMYTTTIGELL